MPKFTKEFLRDALWGDIEGVETIKDTITDTGRWSIHHNWIFKYQDKFYEVGYSEGATEQQDERPFEYDEDEIEVDEVVPVQKLVTVYEAVKKVEPTDDL